MSLIENQNIFKVIICLGGYFAIIIYIKIIFVVRRHSCVPIVDILNF